MEKRSGLGFEYCFDYKCTAGYTDHCVKAGPEKFLLEALSPYFSFPPAASYQSYFSAPNLQICKNNPSQPQPSSHTTPHNHFPAEVSRPHYPSSPPPHQKPTALEDFMSSASHLPPKQVILEPWRGSGPWRGRCGRF